MTAIRGALQGWQELRTAREVLARQLDNWKPDAVISCTNKDHLCVAPACAERGIPSIWWVNDIVSADFFPWLARLGFLRTARKSATKLVTVGEFGRQALLAQGLPAGLVTTIHNGIPLARYENGNRTWLCQQLGLCPGARLVGMVGRFTPWKGQETFLEMALKLIREGVDAHFVLAGRAFNEEQDFEAKLKSLAAAAPDRIHFIPFQESIADLLSGLDVFVHASRRPEPFGRVIIEAMAARVPVVAARAGAVPEIVTHEKSGLLAAPGSVDEFAAGVKRLLADSVLARTLALVGRQTVEQRFTIERVKADFELVLDSACHSRTT
jgi:glycosyltransferase involved in cell wall biosynthesis